MPDLLAPIRDLLGANANNPHPERWTQHAAARNERGHPFSEPFVELEPSKSCSFCLSAAIVLTYRSDKYEQVFQEIRYRIKQRGYAGIVMFNDDDSTTFTDIINILKEPFNG